MKGEIWKDIEGYEGLYEVSNLGRVKSLNYRHTGKEKIRKAGVTDRGYLFVALCKDGKVKQCRINRLVAQAFLENPQNLPEVNHKNEDKTDNRVENLEWCSKSYNLNYGTRNKRISEKLKGKKKSEEHIKKVAEKHRKPVFSVNKESGLIMFWESISEAEKCTGIANQSISRCCKGKAKSAGNHYWFYADDDDNE